MDRRKTRAHLSTITSGKTLADRLLLLGAGMLCVLMVIVSVITNVNFYRSTKQAYERYAIEVSRSYALSIQNDFHIMQFVGRSVRSQLELLYRGAVDEAQMELLRDMLAYTLDNHSDAYSIRVAYRQGENTRVLRCGREEGGAVVREDAAFLATDIYKNAERERKLRISDVYSDEGTRVVSLVMPIEDDAGQYGGLIFISVPQHYFIEYNDAAQPLGCETFIIDSSLSYVAEPYGTSPGGSVKVSVQSGTPWGEVIKGAVNRGELSYGYVPNPVIGEDCLLVAYPIEAYASFGAFCTLVPMSTIYEGLSTTRVVIVTTIIVMLMTVAAFLLYNVFIRKKMHTDPLTGVYNRQYLNRYLPVIVDNSFVRKQPIALILCDIDYFKHVNDRHGHLVGDAMLRHFCRVLRQAMRKRDWIARYGGEEFLICLPMTGRADAYKIAERLREAVQQSEFAHPETGGRIRVTASFGVVNSEMDTALGMTDLIRAADEKLYAAKHKGRNQVM